MLLGFSSALRRSNLALLGLVDVRFATFGEERYLELTVRRSKTDQEGRGRHVVVPELPGGNPLCAYRALRAWIDAAAITEGPLFPQPALHPRRRAPQRQAHRRPRRRPGGEAALLARRVDARLFSAHSLRLGFATSADRLGVRRSLVREQGGWKDDRMLSVYTRHEAVRENAIREMFKR